MSRYDQYLLQSGSGLSDLGQVYRGNSWGAYQRGRGLGDFFSNVFRLVRPYLASGVRAVTTEMARGGAEVLGNLGTQPIGDLLRQQRDIGIQNLGNKASNKLRRVAFGRGIKRKRASTDELIGGRIKRRRRSKSSGLKRRRRRRASGKRRSKKSKLHSLSTLNFGGRVRRRKRRSKKSVGRPRRKRAVGKFRRTRRRRQTGGKASKAKNAFLQQFLQKKH